MGATLTKTGMLYPYDAKQLAFDVERAIPPYRKPYKQDLKDQVHRINRYVTIYI